jgi:DNA repair exonuclease SbcCD ATPase subunit
MSEERKTSVDDGTVDIEVGEGFEGQEVEIDDVSDQPEEKAFSESEDEHEEYSQSVKKRIDRLTKKMREAERQKEEAIKYAQGVQSEAESIKAKLNAVDQGYLTEYGGRINAETASAQEAFKRAIAVGDPDATLQAQQKLTELQYASSKLEEAKRMQARRSSQEQTQAQQQTYQQTYQQPQQQAAKPDPRAEQWAEKNEWFGNDNTMTFAAYGIHKQLVDEAFDPTSDDYYDELDKRIRGEFPHKFSDTGAKRRTAQTVAGVSRTSSSNGRRQVKLTPSQVAIAKKLNVPLEEYAKYVK